MKNGWKECRLGDLFQIKHGYAFKGQHFGCEGSHIVLTPGNFYDEGGFKKKGDKEKWYSGEIPEDYILSRGDLIVAMTEQAEGLLGSSAIVPEDGLYLHNQRLGLIKEVEGADTRFLYYLFNSLPVRQQIRASCSGVKVRHTSPSRIYEVKAQVPDLPTQRRIAGILSAYDDLIENNLRRIKILEEMAQSLYREWFVHFRFPGHESVPLVDSPLGPIPEGWEVKAIDDVAFVHRGRSYRSNELLEDGGLPFVNLKCVERDGGFRRDGLKRFDGAFKEPQKVVTGDIVMAVTDMTQERRIVARAARVPTLDSDFGVISMDLVKIEPKQGLSSDYLYTYFRCSDFADHVKQHANGANVLHLSPDRIRDHRFSLPPVALRSKYVETAKLHFQQAENLYRRNEILRQTRDLLLPRLLNETNG